MLCFETGMGKAQSVTYFLSAFVSFFVVVPVGITLRNFQGSCMLFAQMDESEKTIWPWSETSCDFTLYMNLAATLLYAFWMGIYSLWVAIPKRFPFARKHFVEERETLQELDETEERFRVQSVNPVFLMINTIIFCMVLSNAVIVTVGLQRTCNWLVDAVGEKISADTCGGVQNKLPWNEYRIIRGETIGVEGHRFYTCLTMACIASWVLFLIWLFQLSLSLSQSFTVCSCEVAEEKRKPDEAQRIAMRRSRMATPIGTPGHMTPGGRGTPPVGGGQPMRPYNFDASNRPAIQPYMMKPPPQHQQRPPMTMQEGYHPPRRDVGQMPQPMRGSRDELGRQMPQPMRGSRDDLARQMPQPMRGSRDDLARQMPQPMRGSRDDLARQMPPQMRRSREELDSRPQRGPPPEHVQPQRGPPERYQQPPARGQPGGFQQGPPRGPPRHPSDMEPPRQYGPPPGRRQQDAPPRG